MEQAIKFFGTLSEDQLYTALGFLGGLFLACAQIPQIHRVQARKSSEDISYAYQVLYLTYSKSPNNRYEISAFFVLPSGIKG